MSACARNTQHLVGDSECTEGPAYWCKNLQTAKQCKAQKYCTERVWAKQMKVSCFWDFQHRSELAMRDVVSKIMISKAV